MQTVFFAVIETRNFTFEAIGQTKAQAIDGLRNAWNAHAQQGSEMGRDVPRFGSDSEGPEGFDVEVTERIVGQGYRDGNALGNRAQQEDEKPLARPGRSPR